MQHRLESRVNGPGRCTVFALRHCVKTVEAIVMLGAIIGDVIGSVHEGAGTKTKGFPLFVPGRKATKRRRFSTDPGSCAG